MNVATECVIILLMMFCLLAATCGFCYVPFKFGKTRAKRRVSKRAKRAEEIRKEELGTLVRALTEPLAEMGVIQRINPLSEQRRYTLLVENERREDHENQIKEEEEKMKTERAKRGSLILKEWEENILRETRQEVNE